MATENHELVPEYQPELSIDGVVDVKTAVGRYQHFNRYEIVDPWGDDSRLFITVTDGTVIVA